MEHEHPTFGFKQVAEYNFRPFVYRTITSQTTSDILCTEKTFSNNYYLKNTSEQSIRPFQLNNVD